MARVLTTVSLGTFFAFAAPDVVEAQVCTGQAAFGRYALQASANYEFNNDAKSFGAAIAAGGRRPFGEFAASRTTFSGMDGSTITLGGGFGYQVPLDHKGMASLCPAAAVAFGIGPNNVDLSGNGTYIVNFSETEVHLGASAGVVATESKIHRNRFIPTASFTVVRGTSRIRNDLNGITMTDSKTFELLGLGAGVVFNQTVSLLAGTTIPIGLSGASTTFHVSLSLNVARYAQ